MLLTFGLPLAIMVFYVVMATRERPLEELVRDKDFWLPLALMAVMVIAQILFGLIGLIAALVLFVVVAKRKYT